METVANNVNDLSKMTGGAYIPPAKLRLLQEKITDKSSEAYQRLSWDALKKTINGLINKINIDNFNIIIKKLFSENIIRGRGILARTIIVAQTESPALTHVYAAVVAVVNSKFSHIGLLIIERLLNDFRKAYKRNDKKRCLTCCRFFGHLVNQNVLDEILIMELLILLLDKPSNNGVEIAIGIMKEVGATIERKAKPGSMALFDKFRHLLNEGTLDKRVNYMIEVLFQIRKDKYKDYVPVREGLDVVSPEDQQTHFLELCDEIDVKDELNVFKFDDEYLINEERYQEIKEQILPDSDDEEDEDGDEADDEVDNEESEKVAPQTIEIVDQSFLSTVELRKKIYLKIQSSLTFMDAAHLLCQIPLRPGDEQLYEMSSMILDCCAQLRIYEDKFGSLGQQMCLVDRRYVEQFEKLFCENYGGIHRLDVSKIKNIAMFFAHLLCSDTISWGVFVVVRLTERDTTSSGRIFLKYLFQEMQTILGLSRLCDRFIGPEAEPMQIYFANLFPRDDLKDTKFAINFFTAIELGRLTVEMRAFFEEAKRLKASKQEKERERETQDKKKSEKGGKDKRASKPKQRKKKSPMSSSSSSSDSSSDSSSSSSSESSGSSEPIRKKLKN